MSAICRLSRVIVCLSAIVSIGTQLLIMMIWSSASNEGYPKVREDFTFTEKTGVNPVTIVMLPKQKYFI